MLYIHPPLAIAGYVLIFLFAAFMFLKKRNKRTRDFLGIGSWILTFFGLFSGMIWAQLAWGSYWSWDPKEVMTLVLFLTVTLGQLVYYEKRYTATKWVAVLTCVITILTASSSFIINGLHSFS